MCPKRPMSPPIVSEEAFDPVLYKLFTNFRLAGITPEQLSPAQRTRYAIFLDVCRSFPVAATMEMPLLSSAEMVISSCARRGDNGTNLSVGNSVADTVRIFYKINKDNMMSQQYDKGLAKDWSSLLLTTAKDIKSDEVEVFAAGDGLEEQACSSISAVENFDVYQNVPNGGDAEAISGCHDASTAPTDEHISGAVGGQQDEIDI